MEPFACRPIPVMGESLSGYLIRTAAHNCSDIFSLIREIKAAPKLNETVLYHQIDSNPKKLDLNLVMNLTKLEPAQLFAMTYQPLFQKFIETDELDIAFKSILRNQTEVQYRRFCPACLQQYCSEGKRGVFKIIWQVKDIELCHIHQTPLTSICPKCGAKQRYITNELGDYICFECGEELFINNELNIGKSALNDCDNQVFQLWDYLFDSGTKGLIKTPGLKYEVQMAITLLYLLHKKDDKGRADLAPLMSKLERRKALLFIQNRDTNLFVTPYRLSTLLTRAGASANDFFDTIVPEDFIELITKRLDMGNIELERLEEKNNRKQTVRHKWEPEHVKTLVLEYLRQRPNSKVPVTNKEVYFNISVSNSSVSSEIGKEVTKMVKEYNKQQKEAIYKEIEQAAIALFSEGRIFTYKMLADKVGVHIMFIKRDKEIIRRINNLKASHSS